jgi:homoserine O-acetyltransferase
VNYLRVNEPFELESGESLSALEIAYTTYGTLNPAQDNVVWICHALTANADPMEWWPGLVGAGRLFDPDRYFIVCANMLGSCYGTTGPASENPVNGKPYRLDFPEVTVRDMVRAHERLREHLGIERIALAIGGSMGGQQALEWAILAPERIERIALLATNARHSPWGVAFNEAQRMAIRADASLYDADDPEAGRRGLEAARAVAMLSYRNYQTYAQTQSESGDELPADFRAATYQRYQGLKLSKRFDVFAYLTLSRAMDSHHVGRGRGGVAAALSAVRARTLVISIQSDVLFPVAEQVEIANHIPRAQLEIIDSLYGHDGFLIENEQIGLLVRRFMEDEPFQAPSFGYKLNGARATSRTPIVVDSLALPGTEKF